MTITFLQPDGVPITAQAERQGSAALYGGGSGRRLGGRSGFRVDTPTTILTASSTTWTLTPCSAQIDPMATTHQGMYGWATDANVTGSVTAADATYARKDIVYIQVNDSSAGDGSGALTANVSYLAGTPASTPVAPTLPVRSFLVGTISVPVSGGGSPTVVRNPAVFVAAGAPLPVDLAERDALDKYDTLTVQRRDIAGRPTETWDGAAWKRELQIEVKAATPSAPLLKVGTVTASSDVNGTVAFTFDAPFPTGIYGALANQATAAAIGSIVLKYDEGLSNTTRAAFYVYDMAGALVPNLVNFRACYTAFGH
jgi:hypothetical protein